MTLQFSVKIGIKTCCIAFTCAVEPWLLAFGFGSSQAVDEIGVPFNTLSNFLNFEPDYARRFVGINLETLN